MLHKVKPELTLYLAEEALKRKYEKPQVNLQEILELQKECRDYLSSINMKKIYARMMKREITRQMVEAVYKTLTAEEQEFVRMKYKEKKQMVSISLALNVSLSQLNIRQHTILEKVSEFMLYKLREEDIFERAKISNMVKILARMLEFTDRYDPQREIITTGWWEAMVLKLDNYYALLEEVEEVIKEDTLRAKIIFEKMKNPNIKIEVLAENCNVDKSVVSRCLKNFVDSVKKYLE